MTWHLSGRGLEPTFFFVLSVGSLGYLVKSTHSNDNSPTRYARRTGLKGFRLLPLRIVNAILNSHRHTSLTAWSGGDAFLGKRSEAMVDFDPLHRRSRLFVFWNGPRRLGQSSGRMEANVPVVLVFLDSPTRKACYFARH